MPTRLLPEYDSLDAIPEPARDAYEEREGRFVYAKPIEVELLPDVANLKSAHEKTKRELQKLSDRMAAYGDSDPEAVAKLRTDYETLKAAQGGSKEEMERALQQVRDGHAKELKDRDEKLTKVTGKLQTRERDWAITSATTGYEFVSPAAQKMFTRTVSDSVQIAENEDGEYIAQVLDEKGKVRYSKKTGEPMTVKELVDELLTSDEYKAIVKGHGASGGDVSGGAPRIPGRMVGGKRQVTKAQMEDREFYNAMAAEAKKANKHVMDYVTVVDD